jgi:hypothetical protein
VQPGSRPDRTGAEVSRRCARSWVPDARISGVGLISPSKMWKWKIVVKGGTPSLLDESGSPTCSAAKESAAPAAASKPASAAPDNPGNEATV